MPPPPLRQIRAPPEEKIRVIDAIALSVKAIGAPGAIADTASNNAIAKGIDSYNRR